MGHTATGYSNFTSSNEFIMFNQGLSKNAVFSRVNYGHWLLNLRSSVHTQCNSLLESCRYRLVLLALGQVVCYHLAITACIVWLLFHSSF